MVPAALPLEALPSPHRLRPYIYVYNLPPEFNADLLQYRIERGFCSYKGFMPGEEAGPELPVVCEIRRSTTRLSAVSGNIIVILLFREQN